MTNEAQTFAPAQGGQIPIGACYRLPDFEFYHADSLLKMKELESESVNCILTDPPYKYLKNQKLEVDFDETIFFNEVKRVLKKDGFIVLFGRGTSFYRWNSMLAILGFIFKEEIVWDKRYSSSPLMAMSRVHETVSIHTKNNGTINKIKIPYIEMKQHDLDAIIIDIKRLKSCFKNTIAFEAVSAYLENNNVRTDFNINWNISSKEATKNINSSKDCSKEVTIVNSITTGMNEKSIIRSDYNHQEKFTKYSATCEQKQKGDRKADTINSICAGMNEKSIIVQPRDHWGTIHPTQKPVRLLERLLALTTKEGDLIIDPFAGSCSTGEACLNTKRKFIGYEIDHEYFIKATERLKNVEPLLFSGCL